MRGSTARWGRVAVVTLAATLQTGCFWAVPGQDGNRQAHNPYEDQISVATVGGLQQAWVATVGAGPVGAPVTSASAVHVSDGHSVYAFDRSRGGERWRYTPEAPRQVGQPFVWGNVVLSGEALATVPEGESVQAATVALESATGVSLGHDQTGAIRALRGNRALYANGLWRLYPIPQPVWVWIVSFAVRDLMTADEAVVRETDSGLPEQVLTLDLTLDDDWVYLSHIGALPPPPGGPPTGLRGYHLDDPPADCAVFACPRWAVDGMDPPDPAPPAPLLSDDLATAFTVTTSPEGAGVLYALDALSGGTLWTGALAAPPQGLPALADGQLYVPTTDGDLAMFAATGCGSPTCAPQWVGQTESAGASLLQPAVGGGVVFAAFADGSIHAFDATGCGSVACPPLWSISTGSPITGAPAISNGQLYLGTEDGRLIAYGLT